ncbi:MAG: PDZ domain-containing protein [Planctomycetota bacterium]
MFESPISRLASALLLALTPSACVEVTEARPPAQHLLPRVEVVREELESQPFVGLTLEEELSGSLDQFEFATGLRVVAVAAGSPAEVAGIRAGDLVLKAAGVSLQGLDTWHALLGRQQPGGVLELAVERNGGVSDVALNVAQRGGARLAVPARFVERFKARVSLETVVAERQGSQVSLARVTELFEGSPFLAAGVLPGTLVLSVDGSPVTGGQELARSLAAMPYGSELELGVQDEQGVRVVELELFAPERILTGLAVPILFTYEHDPAEDRVEFALLDFWLFALYDYRRDMRATRHRFLRFFVFETGVGELTELEGTPAAGMNGEAE